MKDSVFYAYLGFGKSIKKTISKWVIQKKEEESDEILNKGESGRERKNHVYVKGKGEYPGKLSLKLADDFSSPSHLSCSAFKWTISWTLGWGYAMTHSGGQGGTDCDQMVSKCLVGVWLEIYSACLILILMSPLFGMAGGWNKVFWLKYQINLRVS